VACKAVTSFSCAGCFDAGVEGQMAGALRDLVDQSHNVPHVGGGVGQGLYRLIGGLSIERCFLSQLIRLSNLSSHLSD
jgi:hypothetical protein